MLFPSDTSAAPSCLDIKIKMDLATILNQPETDQLRKAKIKAPRWQLLVTHRPPPPPSDLVVSIDHGWTPRQNQQYSLVEHGQKGHTLVNAKRAGSQYGRQAQRRRSLPYSPEHSSRVTKAIQPNQDRTRQPSSDGGPSRQSPRLPVPPRSPAPHSNQPYTEEQVFFLRYNKEDRELKWCNVLKLFQRRWPLDARETDQSMSSRYYRDNMAPRLDDDGNITFDSRGQVVWIKENVRERNTEEGKKKGVPYTLVDLHPERALQYDWVSMEHKAVARNVLRGIDPTDYNGKKAYWRKIFRTAEALM